MWWLTCVNACLCFLHVDGELIHVNIVKGPAGFGFSVVETPDGHIVKQIMDDLRCSDMKVHTYTCVYYI